MKDLDDNEMTNSSFDDINSIMQWAFVKKKIYKMVE